MRQVHTHLMRSNIRSKPHKKNNTRAMKRFATLLFTLTLCLFTFAGNPIKIVTGKTAIKGILSENATAVMQFDWTCATYDGKCSIGEELGEDAAFVVNDCQNKFVTGFNTKSKGLKLCEQSDGAKYKVLLTVTKMDCFFAAMSFVPRHEGKMWGKIAITSAETGETLFEANIDEAEDGQDMVRKECFGKTFELLGEKVAKLK